MEAAPSGDLRQYLETRTNETYYNVTCSQSLEMNFINQIIEGVEAVHRLDVSRIAFINHKYYIWYNYLYGHRKDNRNSFKMKCKKHPL